LENGVNGRCQFTNSPPSDGLQLIRIFAGAEQGPNLFDFLEEILPRLLGDALLLAPTSGQDDLDAVGRDWLNGDIIQVGRVDAPLEVGGQFVQEVAFGPAGARAFLGFGIILVVYLEDEIGAAGQVVAELEAAFAVLVLNPGFDGRPCGQGQWEYANHDFPEKRFHGRSLGSRPSSGIRSLGFMEKTEAPPRNTRSLVAPAGTLVSACS